MNAPTHRPTLENLEHRHLMSCDIKFAEGLLQVVGSEQSETVTIRETAEHVRVTCQPRSGDKVEFKHKDVSSLSVELAGGDDRLRFVSSAEHGTLDSIFADLGAGDDRASTSQVNPNQDLVISGGEGRNRLHAKMRYDSDITPNQRIELHNADVMSLSILGSHAQGRVVLRSPISETAAEDCIIWDIQGSGPVEGAPARESSLRGSLSVQSTAPKSRLVSQWRMPNNSQLKHFDAAFKTGEGDDLIVHSVSRGSLDTLTEDIVTRGGNDRVLVRYSKLQVGGLTQKN